MVIVITNQELDPLRQVTEAVITHNFIKQK